MGQTDAINKPNKYMESWMKPFWQGDTMWFESCLIVYDELAEPQASLLFEPEEIISVHHSRLDVEYMEGHDWIYDNGKLKFPSCTSIPITSHKALSFLDELPGQSMPRRGVGYVLHHEGSFFHDRQIAITYKHSGNGWKGIRPAGQSHLLPVSSSKLAAVGEFKFVVYGDSIGEGANSSGSVGVPPFMPSWAQLIYLDLERKFPVKVQFSNMSKGGMQSDWGRENAETVAALRPDLTVIAFGMNDGTHGCAPEKFKENIESIMKTIRRSQPDAEFILVSPMLANPETSFAGNQEEYAALLEQLSGEGCVFVDLTALHVQLLQQKRYVDMTGNHINHPNDFLSRWYAQAIAAVWDV